MVVRLFLFVAFGFSVSYADVSRAKACQDAEQQHRIVVERVRQAAKTLLALKPSSFRPPRFEKLNNKVSFSFGSIFTDNDQTDDGDLIAELIRQEALQQALQQAFETEYPASGFWEKHLADAEAALQLQMTEANLSVVDVDAVAQVRQDMDQRRALLRTSFKAFLQHQGLITQSIPDQWLGGPAFNVKVVTSPLTTNLGYVSLSAALRQLVPRDSKLAVPRFPEGIVYGELVNNPVKLRGRYLFKVTWPTETRYFQNVNVEDDRDLKFFRGE